MRIAFIAPFGLQPKGTVSARMLPLAYALAERGHLVRMVIPPWDDPSAAQLTRAEHTVTLFEEGNNPPGAVHRVTLPLPRRVPYSFGLTAGLVRAALRPPSRSETGFVGEVARLLDFRPEVVHVFKPIGYSGLAGLALSAIRVPWVLDTDDWEGPGGWADVNPYSPAQKVAATLQDAFIPRLADAVTAASRTLEARAWTFGLPRNRVIYLPNGAYALRDLRIETRRNVRREALSALRGRYGLAESPVLLLYTRFAEFPWTWPLDILEMVKKERPGVKMLVVGSGFFGEEKSFEHEAARRGLGDNVVVTGRVPEDEVSDHLLLGDVALYPMEDTLLNRAKSPVKVLEPMELGLPLVAHRVGQAAEFVSDAGVLIEPGDVKGMAHAASALLANPERRKSLGGRAQQRAWNCFNWRKLSAKAEQAYAVALARRGRTSRPASDR